MRTSRETSFLVPSSEPRRSAALILYRTRREHGLEVFLVERAPHLKFLGGHFAFPGGSAEAGDHLVPFAGEPPGQFLERELIGCAARELFEETGILLAEPGSPARGRSPERMKEARAAVSREGQGSAAFRAFLEENGLAIDATLLVPATRLVTPRFSRARFDTTFYLVETAGEPEVLPGELVRGAWRPPSAALEDWRTGAIRIAPPVVSILEVLAAKPLAAALEELRRIPPEYEGSGREIPIAPGYGYVPLETPPLPPEIPTNTILVGRKRFLVVDPAPRGAQGQAHLFAVLDRRLAAGDDILAIVLTHHHPDHVGALDATVARYRAPVWGHPATGNLLGRKLDRELNEGDSIDLGDFPGGNERWSLRVLFTPGHAEGHIALHDERSRSLLAGDLVSTLVSMYVGSPGGSLRRYFASLERIRDLPLEVLHPSHGVASHEPRRLIEHTLLHRRERIEEIYEALGEIPRETEALAEAVYPEARGKLRPLVVRTTRAALEYLTESHRAVRQGEDSYRKA